MFCPQCGQKQLPEGVRFCSSCGFPLEGVTQLLASGGNQVWSPPTPPAGAGPLTPRRKGIRQGAMLFASTFLVVPVFAILFVGLMDFPGELVALAAVICFVGGILRMLYARFFEEDAVAGAALHTPQYVPQYVPPDYLGTQARGSSLPPGQAQPAAGFRPQRFDTGELVTPPPSVVDHTTRLLGKQTDEPPEK
jgi:hypothetical protein